VTVVISADFVTLPIGAVSTIRHSSLFLSTARVPDRESATAPFSIAHGTANSGAAARLSRSSAFRDEQSVIASDKTINIIQLQKLNVKI
jgi:hypothetical protein